MEIYFILVISLQNKYKNYFVNKLTYLKYINIVIKNKVLIKKNYYKNTLKFL